MRGESMSDEKELTGLKEHEVQGECRHHWIIDSPAGPVSKGLCRLCGEERLFQNYLEGGGWDDKVTLEQVSSGSRYPSTFVPSEGRVEE